MSRTKQKNNNCPPKHEDELKVEASTEEIHLQILRSMSDETFYKYFHDYKNEYYREDKFEDAGEETEENLKYHLMIHKEYERRNKDGAMEEIYRKELELYESRLGLDDLE